MKSDVSVAGACTVFLGVLLCAACVYARMYGAFLRHTVGGRSVSEGSERPEHGIGRPQVSGNGNNLNADRLVARLS